MTKKSHTTDAQTAVILADYLIKALDEMEINPNIAQSALGNAWFRVCHAMGMKQKDFEKILKEMSGYFKSQIS